MREVSFSTVYRRILVQIVHQVYQTETTTSYMLYVSMFQLLYFYRLQLCFNWETGLSSFECWTSFLEKSSLKFCQDEKLGLFYHNRKLFEMAICECLSHVCSFCGCRASHYSKTILSVTSGGNKIVTKYDTL